MARIVAITLLLATLAAPVGADQQPVAEVKTPLSSDKALVAECGIGDLVADALRSQTGADLALVNGSALRSPYTIDKGPVTEQTLKKALAYPDEKVATLKLKGSTVIAALERGLALLPKPNKGFLQISGLKVWYDPSQPPDHRVNLVEHKDKRLSPDHVYRVAMPNALAKGGLGYFRIFEGAPYQASEVTMAQALVAHARAVKVIDLDPAKKPRYRDIRPK